MRTVLGSFLLCASAVHAAPLAFEVASIKPAGELNPAAIMSGKLRIGRTIDGARAEFRFQTLADLIQYAYNVKAYQVSGPDWVKSERFDIQAKLPDGATKEQVPEMLQTLLAERFKLILRKDQTENAVYGMVVAKGGPKLKETEPDPPAAAGADGVENKMSGFTGNTTKFNIGSGGEGRATVLSGGAANVKMSVGAGLHVERKMTMGVLADFLGRFVGRPVIDLTELKGTYEVAMDVPMADLMRSSGSNVVVSSSGGAGDPAAVRQALDRLAEQSEGNTIFAAVQKLGLKLESRKAPVELLVVERAEKAPIEN